MVNSYTDSRSTKVASLLNHSDLLNTCLKQPHSNELCAVATADDDYIDVFLNRISLEARLNPRVRQEAGISATFVYDVISVITYWQLLDGRDVRLTV